MRKFTYGEIHWIRTIVVLAILVSLIVVAIILNTPSDSPPPVEDPYHMNPFGSL